MPKKIDLTGKRFGRLTVIEETDNRSKHGDIFWKCKCDCGSTIEVLGKSLKQNNTKSCGCYKKDFDPIRAKKTSKPFLKEGTRLTNLNNTMLKNNTSGVKGVSWHKKRRAWEAYIEFQGKKKHLGLFDNLSDAAQARKEAEEKYFKPILEKYEKR